MVPPASVQAAIEGVQAVLEGRSRSDLCEIALDMSRLTPFQRQVYEFVRAIPPGQTRTYGEVALALGDAGLARAVGQAKDSARIITDAHPARSYDRVWVSCVAGRK
jgi:methylated-DNA-[protein]-cysteine S-methyltransferase